MYLSTAYNFGDCQSCQTDPHSGSAVARGPARNIDPTRTTSLGRVGSFLGNSSCRSKPRSCSPAPHSSPAAAGRPVTAAMLSCRTSPTGSGGAGFLSGQAKRQGEHHAP